MCHRQKKGKRRRGRRNLLTDVTRSSDVVLSGSRAPLAHLIQNSQKPNFEDYKKMGRIAGER